MRVIPGGINVRSQCASLANLRDMNTLPGIANAVAGLRLETEQLARDQLEAQVAELEFMHESEGFAPEDWVAEVEECVFRLVRPSVFVANQGR